MVPQECFMLPKSDPWFRKVFHFQKMFHGFEIMIHDSEKCSMAHSNVSWLPAVFHGSKICFMLLQNVSWFLQLFHGWRSVSWFR